MTGLANDLNISESGFVTHNGAGIFHGRTLTAGTGITITNGDGISANPVISSTAASTDLHVARFIVAQSTVGTGANFNTINAAIAAAQGTGINSTIFIQPGTYTEDITLFAGINLCAFECDAFTPNVTIVGKLTATFAGTVSLSGIRLQTNGDYLLAVTGTSATIVNLRNCYLNCTNNTGINFTSTSASSMIFMSHCFGNLTTTGIAYFSHSGSGVLQIRYCTLTNDGGSSTANTISSGSLFFRYTSILSPITTSGTAGFTFLGSIVQTSATNTISLTLGGSGSHEVNESMISSGSAVPITITSTATVWNSTLNSSNANHITGAGTLQYGALTSFGSTGVFTTTTQAPRVTSNDAVQVTTPGAYPYTTVPQDVLILVDSSAARTITPLASPTTGQKHIIKDSVGSAAANNITITPSGKNIDGAASYVINVNYGSVTIIFGGTEWHVV